MYVQLRLGSRDFLICQFAMCDAAWNPLLLIISHDIIKIWIINLAREKKDQMSDDPTEARTNKYQTTKKKA